MVIFPLILLALADKIEGAVAVEREIVATESVGGLEVLRPNFLHACVVAVAADALIIFRGIGINTSSLNLIFNYFSVLAAPQLGNRTAKHLDEFLLVLRLVRVLVLRRMRLLEFRYGASKANVTFILQFRSIFCLKQILRRCNVLLAF